MRRFPAKDDVNYRGSEATQSKDLNLTVAHRVGWRVCVAGNFYEGFMATGYATDATDAAVHANIVAANYKNV